MSVVNCNLDYGAGGDTCEVDDKFIRRHTRRWIVKTNSNYDTAYGVLTGASLTGPVPIPLIYARHPTDTLAFARKAKADRAEDPRKWFVTVEYDNQVDTSRNVENPIDRPPIVRLKFAQFQKPTPKDQDGNLICTTAGQPIIPAIEVDNSRPIITVERNEASFAAMTAIDYQDAISTDVFYGSDPGCAKMQNVDIGEERFENGVRFRTATYEIHFDRDGWQGPILNRGTKFYDSTGPNRKLVKVPSGGNPVMIKQDGTLLNGSGEVMLDANNNVIGDKPYYINPPRYKLRAFGALNLEYTLLPIT